MNDRWRGGEAEGGRGGGEGANSELVERKGKQGG